MASTTGPDLAAGVEAVENLMDDACLVTRPDLDGATLNTTTGEVESDDPMRVYDHTSTGTGGRSLADADGVGGKCMVSGPGGGEPQYIVEGGDTKLDETRVLKVPIDAPQIIEGDIVKMLSSRRDPQLVNLTFRVVSVVQKTFVVSRPIVLEPV